MKPFRARFLLRFDDLCPTVNWSIWDEIEPALIDCGAKPIVSVVPDNRDKELVFGSPGENFWERVRSWQERGWTIGLHGYQHCYLTSHAGLYGRVARSEFAGLPYEIQEIKLRNAVRIFHENKVRPELWVAPAHSFDHNTVAALVKLGIHVINDGYALFPYEDHRGVTWIPQQVGRFRRMPLGIWTICFHFNHWTAGDVRAFRSELQRFRNSLASVPEVLQSCSSRRNDWFEAHASKLLSLGLRAGRWLREGLRREPRRSRAKTWGSSESG